jgi:hypothetical protein
MVSRAFCNKSKIEHRHLQECSLNEEGRQGLEEGGWMNSREATTDKRAQVRHGSRYRDTHQDMHESRRAARCRDTPARQRDGYLTAL